LTALLGAAGFINCEAERNLRLLFPDHGAQTLMGGGAALSATSGIPFGVKAL